MGRFVANRAGPHTLSACSTMSNRRFGPEQFFATNTPALVDKHADGRVHPRQMSSGFIPLGTGRMAPDRPPIAPTTAAGVGLAIPVATGPLTVLTWK